MEALLQHDLISFAKTVGIMGIFLITFAESGLFIGFFLPGDSLLFTAGFLASQGYFHIGLLMSLCFAAAVLGDSVGYSFGKRVGKKMFTKENSLFFRKNHLHRASEFYARHGGKTIILARFMPIVRTFAPIVAGVGEMRYTSFLFYNIIGGGLWAVGLISLGYFLGSTIPNVDRYLLPIIGSIILLSVTPPALHMWKHKRRKTV